MNTLSNINVLSEVLQKSEERFRDAACDVDSPDLETVFRECSRERELFRHSLGNLARSMDHTVAGNQLDVCFPPRGDGPRHDRSILAECERIEAAAIVFYERALRQHGNPDEAIDLLHEQYRKIWDSRDRLQALRKSAENDERGTRRAA